MAKITFSFEELIHILSANALLPAEVTRLQVAGDRIDFVIKTGAFMLPAIPASIRYLSFDGRQALFELIAADSRINKAIVFFEQMIKSKLPSFVGLDLPKISLDIDMLFEQREIRGIQVSDICMEEDGMTIVTCCP